MKSLHLGLTEYQFYIDALCACYRDVASAFPAQQQKEHERDLAVMLSRASCEGIEFLTKTLPSLAKAIDYALATGTVLQAPSFARKKGSKLPKFMGWLIELVFSSDGTEKADADPVALKYLRSLLYLFYKLELPHTTNQENDIYCTFKEVDQGLQKPWDTHDPQHNHAVKYAARLVGRIFSGVCPRQIEPRHGPGSTADGAKSNEKPNFMGFFADTQRYYLFDEYYYWSPSHVLDRLTASGLGLADGGPARDLGVSTAKVVLVPKDSRGPRLISMEPTEIQWLQQGQLSLMVRTIEEHWTTRDHVNFENQEVNRVLAMYASVNGDTGTVRLATRNGREPAGRDLGPRGVVDGLCSPEHGSRPRDGTQHDVLRRPQPIGSYVAKRVLRKCEVVKLDEAIARCKPRMDKSKFPIRLQGELARNGCDLVTLDMKDASDRVSLQLVQCLFPSNWVEALEATRSPQTRLPTGEIVPLNKFAPMGSAVCFPVEAVCFWALAIAAIHLRYPTLPLKRLRERVWVYGDDIICYRTDYPVIIAVLEAVGLKFNSNKCCTAGSFRESCGMDAYRGIQVTPTRIKSRWSHRLGVQELASYVSYSNDLYESGFHELATFIEMKVQANHRIPYTCVYGGGVQFVRPSADILALNRARGVKMRFNSRHHTLEASGFVCSPVTTPGPADTHEALLYRMAQSGRLGSTSGDDQGLRSFDAGGKPPSNEPLPVGLYPLARRVTKQRAWTLVYNTPD